MHELDTERAYDLYGDEWLTAAAWYRDHALDVVTHPDLALEQPSHPAVSQKVRAEFAANTRRRAEMFEALSYGDPGFLLTTPGPSLSGVLVDTLGTEVQREYFRSYVGDHLCRTFFAVTEPNRGSDAAHVETRYTDARLTGEKLLFGNGAVAPLGTVLARTGDGPLDTVALLLPPDLVAGGQVTGRVLDMFAMHGAQLSHLQFDGLEVPETLVLGHQLKPIERGLMGMIKTFHRFRPGVASMALGTGQALTDYTRRYFPQGKSACDTFDHALAEARSLNRAAAADVDRDPLSGTLVSLAKHRAVAVTEEIVTTLSRGLPIDALLDHPWLLKTLNDAFAFDYMEGTAPIQLGNIHNGFLRSEIGVRQ